MLFLSLSLCLSLYVSQFIHRVLHSDGVQIVDRPRPQLPSESSTLLTDHDDVAIVCVPGIRQSVIVLGVDPASFELLCAQIVSRSSTFIIVVIY